MLRPLGLMPFAHGDLAQVLKRWAKPFLTAFSDQDPITRGGERVLQKLISGSAGRAHPTIEGGAHFLQEDCGEALAHAVTDIARTGLSQCSDREILLALRADPRRGRSTPEREPFRDSL
jgi:pimeloyl-ACP methyl ester carboxylesterase